MTAPDYTAIFNQVRGFLSIEEAKLLFELASQVPSGGTIVEIGSYQGRSSVLLGLGAKEAGAHVYAIDPHEEYSEGDTHYGMDDNQHYYENIAKFELGSIVRTINRPSTNSGFGYVTDLLFIDGSHDYEDVLWDLKHYSRMLSQTGKIAIHDTAGHHIGVTRALADFMRDNEQWTIVQQVDAIAVLSRYKTE